MNKIEWLNQEPPIEEVARNNDGSEFIPIAIVENLLDEFTNNDWGTANFRYYFHPYSTTVLISGSLELSVTYYICHKDGREIHGCRTLIGAVTFTDDTHGSNLNFAATAKSECIKNAAKQLGRRFGRYLNDRGVVKEKDIQNKPIMDVITRKKYDNAKKHGDVKTQLEIENYYDVTN